MTAPLVDVDGQLLDTWFVPADRRRADRPPLVFLHEGLGAIELWRSFPDAVRSASGGPAMFVYSRAGYGHSGPPVLPRPVTYMHDEADAVLPAVLERFGIERPILVGHSDGASIALLYAGGRGVVAGLVLLAPHVFVEEICVRSITAARDAYDSGDLRSRLAPYHDDVDAAFRGWCDIWLTPEFRSWNIEERLAAVDCPVLLVQGTDDPYGTTAQLDAIEAQVSGTTQRVMLPGVGHSPHIEAPAATLGAVGEFVSTIT